MGDAKPLKRHPALVPLSKDHHFGLLLCWKIRTGIKKRVTSDRIVDYVNYFFNNHLKPHFEEEEQHIFVLLNHDDEKRNKAESQHSEIFRLIDTLTTIPNKSLVTLPILAQELDNHIRFEERDLFPYIQDQLNEPDLEKLKDKIEAIHKTMPDEWNDQFWLN